MSNNTLKKAILDNFGARSPSIVFEIPPDRLVNKEYSENLSREVFTNFEWEVFIASRDIVGRIPETPGLYMFVWKPYLTLKNISGNVDLRYILYVGKANSHTSNLRTRFRIDYFDVIKQHPHLLWDKVDVENREDRLRKYLNLWEIEYWFCSITNALDVEKIEKLEVELISTLNPLINDIYTMKEIEVIKVKATAKAILQEEPPF
ncbi:MAG TPA: hypothetical protein DHO02_05570 [Syntrophaceae bacterium]|nr:hypothetical protein [Syntrophaceae bacterium]